MKLRKWPSEAIGSALLKYQNGVRNFLVLATPGAGKTTMSSVLTERLFKLNLIDLVICITPSVSVKNGFYHDLSAFTGEPMHGGLGARGSVITYQSLSYLKKDFWEIFKQHRIFVIFDEIHHCSGNDQFPGNAWGQALLGEIKENAVHTLSLSGTPWRSDNIPVALANYDKNNLVLPDYVYGLQSAVVDKVCRAPKILAIDNNGIMVRKQTEDKPERFDGISKLIKGSSISFQQILDCEPILKYTLKKAIDLLSLAKSTSPNAAGLVVASNIQHANLIYKILNLELRQSAILVSHKVPNAADLIDEFKFSSIDWIVSIGMISEGTNIPRLQVCCHLSRIKTELYFRQVLGRILRTTTNSKETGHMIILAEDALLSYANRIAEDLPMESATLKVISPKQDELTESAASEVHESDSCYLWGNKADDSEFEALTECALSESRLEAECGGDHITNSTSEISLFGSFLERLITLKLCQLN